MTSGMNADLVTRLLSLDLELDLDLTSIMEVPLTSRSDHGEVQLRTSSTDQ